jgi:hypothetical protein
MIGVSRAALFEPARIAGVSVRRAAPNLSLFFAPILAISWAPAHLETAPSGRAERLVEECGLRKSRA